MKKLIAMLLCFAMVAAFGASAAFAAMPDPISAEQAAKLARDYYGYAKADTEWLNTLGKFKSIMEAYEAVKYDSSKSADDVKAAYDIASAKLTNLGITWYTPDTVSLAQVNTFIKNTKLYIAENTLAAKELDVWTRFFLSTGSTMDLNERVIGIGKLEAAYNLEKAQENATTAKAGAVKAQATAKALIADSIKVAQDAAATAVANAQKDAYNTLASNYADAVEAFWAEVENAWF